MSILSLIIALLLTVACYVLVRLGAVITYTEGSSGSPLYTTSVDVSA